MPFNVLVALAFNLVGDGMVGTRMSALSIVQDSLCAILISLIAMQVGARS